MRKAFFTILFSSTAILTFAQSEMALPGHYRNEFGIDATAFIKQFLNFSQTSSSYSPAYYLTYRRHFKHANLRVAIGGDYASQEIPPSFSTDVNKYHSQSSSVNLRVGGELYSELSKRWQVFYGVDFRPSFGASKNDAPFFNGGYANGSESKSTTFGLAPLLGFRFRLNDRLSVLTETTFSINYQTSSGRRYFIPVTNQYPALPDVDIPQTHRTFTSFAQPVSLIIAFDI